MGADASAEARERAGAAALLRRFAGRWVSCGRSGAVLAALAFVGLFGAARQAAAADDEVARLIILANRDDPESLALAEHYAQVRNVPPANLVALPMPRAEAIDWRGFVDAIFNPLQAWLIERRWIDAIAMDLQDDAGRRKAAVSGHRISYLVVCRGVPLRIEPAPGIPADLPPSAPAQVRTARAAVDSELALLAQSGTRRDGFLMNPLFQRKAPTPAEQKAVVRVVRLDGPSDLAVRSLLQSAERAERDGLIGRAYVDLGGPHAPGDRWLETAAQLLEEAGFAPTRHRGPGTMTVAERADAAALYFGWYDRAVSGPFAMPDYRFPPGAIALHIHSSSAASLRDAEGGGWCGPLIARGVAATFGNVHEPYLEYTHRPDVLLRALLAGATLGEAAYQAMPVLSWQSVVIGDPLYRPFAVARESQLARWRELPPALAGYVMLREAQRLERSGQPEAAREIVREALKRAPTIAVALDFAERQIAAGEREEAVRALRALRRLDRIPPSEVALLAAAARLLEQQGASADALAVWEVLFAQELPPAARTAWLREADATARTADDAERHRRWSDELARLAAEAP